MMYYCDRCHMAVEDADCPYCGKEPLSKVQNGDYCLVAEKEQMWADMLMEILRDQGIPYTSLPVSGAGLTMRTGTMEHIRIYVPYERLDCVRQLLKEAFA